MNIVNVYREALDKGSSEIETDVMINELIGSTAAIADSVCTHAAMNNETVDDLRHETLHDLMYQIMTNMKMLEVTMDHVWRELNEANSRAEAKQGRK